MSRVLIIEDDRELSDVLAYNLRHAGYDVLSVRDGREGIRQAKLALPDVILLDLMLPLIDGLEVCRQLRADQSTANLLIMMLTAKAEDTDQIVGLSVGADDFVTKPFNIKVLLERIKTLQRRRSDAGQFQQVISSQGIQIDRRRHQITAGDQPLALTHTEFRLLETLVRQPGRAFGRAELIEATIGSDSIVLERTVDVHIRALRRKLGDFAHLVETVRGVGYRFHDERL